MASEGASGREIRAYAIRVSGVVQGVGFRAATRREALRVGVMGHVRNEFDGSVSVHAEGEPAALAALLDWCRRGPRDARVESVEHSETRPRGAATFEVLY